MNRLYIIAVILAVIKQGSFLADSGTKLKKIKDKILENYNKNEEPNGTSVYVTFFIGKIYLDDENDVLSAEVHVAMEWEDPRLTWNGTDYDDVRQMLVSENDVWTPELVLISDSRFPSVDFDMHRTSQTILHLSVTSFGYVYFHSTINNFRTHCEVDVKNWPNDVQTCFIKFGTSTGSTFRLNQMIDFITDPYIIKTPQKWICKINKPVVMINGTMPGFRHVIETEFTFTRHSSIYDGLFIIPSLLIMAVTLALFCLKPQNSLRIVFFGILNVIEFYLLLNLNMHIPSVGFSVPLIVEYFNGLQLTTYICTVETIILRFLLTLNSCPVWLKKLDFFIQKIKSKSFKGSNFNKKMTVEDEDSVEEDNMQNLAVSLNEGDLRKCPSLENSVAFMDNLLFFTVLLNSVRVIILQHF